MSVTLFAQEESQRLGIPALCRPRHLEEPIRYVPSDEYEVANAEGLILAPPPQRDKKPMPKPPAGLPPYLASLYATPLLDREEEVYYFRKMNFLEFRAVQLRDRLNGSRRKSRDMDRIEDLLEASLTVKNFLIRSNLRLVVSIAKRRVTPNANLFELISDGNMTLMRAVERFDYRRGNRFSTYATWAIVRHFARVIPSELVRQGRFRTGMDAVFGDVPDTRSNHLREELINRQQRRFLLAILEHLDDREKNILMLRYGLKGRTHEPQTLQELGDRLGVTKERIRQIEKRALSKLRNVIEADELDVAWI